MASAVSITRRTLMALTVAFGLALMHGGIGQAASCSGMAAMNGTTSTHVPTAIARVSSVSEPSGPDDTEHAVHHQPDSDPNVSHSMDMCVSEPGMSGAGGTKAGPTTAAIEPLAVSGQPLIKLSISPQTGREPPVPDLVSVLCVNRR